MLFYIDKHLLCKYLCRLGEHNIVTNYQTLARIESNRARQIAGVPGAGGMCLAPDPMYILYAIHSLNEIKRFLKTSY